MKAIAQKEIIGESGLIRIEKGKEYEVEKIVRKGYLHPNGYRTNDRVEGYEFRGSLFATDVFEIQKPGIG